MPHKSTQPKTITDDLRAQGFKVTAARRAVVSVLCAHPAPLSVADLLSGLSKLGIKADKTTVYREVLFMQERGLVEQVQFDDQVKRYELRSGGHHHHLVCGGCGSVADVPLENDLTAIEKKIERRTGFKIGRHSLEFFGTCRNCR